MKLIVSEFLSLDGVMEGPGAEDSFEKAGWTMQFGSQQAMKFKFEELMSSQALLIGRLTYDGFASAWPGREDEMGFADKMNNLTKYVMTSSKDELKWNNSHALDIDSAVDAIKKLKAKDGGELLVYGSSKLVKFLMDNELIDELRLMVYPVILGIGKRLFENGKSHKLELADCQKFDNGVLLLTYSPV
jgi:dihydrofolate reductase